ncbi:DUF4212 domain-containing protein [Diaphorobacter ruginosibacter]|jgi:putative solute:sodium symporter small subunit|uniref:DUF4212 domain-containing protein n=1 Tax=Diaphorobacter ruginosibacter TaxID=1715720 RepID=A0A7G9RSE4_9BURK|nr:DUF4212 domain-containing protein [Diaphorobacter ruginosibacter]MDR2335491.1 DUF4212 domain-containing protein [Burkholderiaceae bacterium]QNN58519.1 DUF4212 domain-containing protein [Diaphorobacter ruginosibacter]
MLPHSENDEHVGTPFPPDMHDARHLWLKAGLLSVWAMVTFGVCWFVRDLTWSMGQWQFGYWIVAQGAVLMFIVIICVYCAAMNHFERQDQQRESSATPSDE